MSEEKTFEQRMEALEEAVRRLESGEEPLEASLAIYEEVVRHLKACHETLDAAEQRVKVLVDGVLTDFDAAE